MRVSDLIRNKRQGEALSGEDISTIITGYTKGSIPDYQMAALCMAIYFQGMTAQETSDLTMAMAQSGDLLDLSAIEGRIIDKHSTGGVGDTTTLVLAPLVASCGVPVAKMSGRGLGHTGGTIDKLESIPGFRTDLSKEQFTQQVNDLKVAVMAQTAELAPADKLLYALRDVTATVESIPLIASSIMSKKIAAGADGFVLDVKTGSGAFMQTFEDAKALAEAMVSIGSSVGRDTVALVTDMSQPLGCAIGNTLEVKEAITVLQGKGPEDLRTLCLELGAEMLLLAHYCSSRTDALTVLKKQLSNGAALDRFAAMIHAQKGDPRITEDLSLLPQARIQYEVKAEGNGFIRAMDSLALGNAAMVLGAGREDKNSVIQNDVGIVLTAKVGSRIDCGDTLAIVHAANEADAEAAALRIRQAVSITEAATDTPPFILTRISGDDVNS